MKHGQFGQNDASVRCQYCISYVDSNCACIVVCVDRNNYRAIDSPMKPTPKSCDDCALYNGSYGEIDCAECVNKSEWVDNIWMSENLPPEIKPSTIEDRRTWGETETTPDMVNSPNHYAGHYPLEVKDYIQICLAIHEDLSPWEAYCLGNELKYRLRAGLKGDAVEDIAKAMKYAEFRSEDDV